ncbi:amino acid ABC transporter substrate-binding protein [Bradyrhizobium sp. CIAT3101]|uniref:amino acid ABC transporter substrate-binding protein n=1 Tax=Bradyrhizobium sp. CIAT3101 TaxID=439387 RepID=UPI0024B0F90A|nr:amino acid ABC transporter substrate-binding protein [Bradyrhizobium sp. CIAT3101]WFU78209.1 amino acid ABC transporter substrate-binding protein [Bradyrhizobium sp. CIAT3101]
MPLGAPKKIKRIAFDREGTTMVTFGYAITRAGRPHSKLAVALGAAALVAAMAIAPLGAQAQTQSGQSTSASDKVDTLGAIKARGYFICGVAGDRPGFSFPDSKGVMQGLDADICRSVAAAIFGDPEKIRFTSLTSLTRFPALQSGEVDMLARFTTWTLTREASLGLDVASIYFYDGQGFMVKKSLGVKSALELDGATVCVTQGSTSEANMVDFFRTHNLALKPIVIEKVEQVRDALANNRCDAYTNDSSLLGSLKLSMGPAGDEYILLPDIISKEPLGTFVRKGDQRFFDIVRWTYIAMLTAEESGIAKTNIDTFRKTRDPQNQRFVGETGDLGAALGLDAQWAVNVVKAVGNTAELWDRTIASLGIQRGANRLAKDGGIQYAPPMR